jgi:cellulose synthase/poly-beta-1,6-N-acetylglucosamine synthase-like glycosyltransferase
VRGQEFWGTTSPSDAYHLPQILPQELQPFGRSGDDFGEVFLRVRGFLLCSSTDRPHVFGGQSAAGGQSVRGRRLFGGLFRQRRRFLAGGFFCTADSSHLFSGQSAPIFRTVRSVRRNLPSLFGSFASFQCFRVCFEESFPGLVVDP